MAFDNSTRNKLQQFVSKARKLLVDEFTSQLQTFYGIQPTGEIFEVKKLTHLDVNELVIASLLRERIKHIESGIVGVKKPTVVAIDRILREQAFTLLNRFAAMRMMEERSLIQESVGNGVNSQGVQLYLQVAGSSLGNTFDRYKTYIHCLWDEIALDLGVLFDRNSPFGLLFPRESALGELFNLIDDKEIAPLWKEDETIGWIYQYYNSKAEREEMRDASAAPRNSRELAVRNQFFTPRYVVQFLTDNTLGRIWFEMTQSKTTIKEFCEYLVVRPNEVFLKANEKAPEIIQEKFDKTKEELLNEPYYVEFRELKDPREISMIDPACGSMHFGLYAFDLFEKIYEEAWDNFSELFIDLRKKFNNNKEEFLKLVPQFIIQYNIHGIDIDPRAVQIANLSLWLRAQKAWNLQKVKSKDRPVIKKSNIVCAEPMPGESDLLEQFVKSLDPPILGVLVKDVWEKMQLAGEAGSLLKVEEDIQSSIDKAYDEWKQIKKTKPQLTLFGEAKTPQQEVFDFELAKVQEDFWIDAESNVLTSLRKFVAKGIDKDKYKAVMFLEDSEKGFAFIDLCKKKYDVVLMNPPFGSATEKAYELFSNIYSNSYQNIACVFIERGLELLKNGGILGNIVDIATSIRSNYEDFRRKVLLNQNFLSTYISLGWGVLDNANVETCCYTVKKNSLTTNKSFCSNLENLANKEITLNEMIKSTLEFVSHFNLHLISQMSFASFPNAAISFTLPKQLRELFISHKSLEPEYSVVKKGISSGDNQRFYKLLWEVPYGKSRWKYLANGGDFSPYYRTSKLIIDWGNDGHFIKNLVSNNGKLKSVPRNIKFFDNPGFTFSKRGKYLNVQIHPNEFGFTDEGQGIFNIRDDYKFAILALLNSQLLRVLINEYCGQHKSNGYVKLLPIVEFDSCDIEFINRNVEKIILSIRKIYSNIAEHPEYMGISFYKEDKNLFHSLAEILNKILKDVSLTSESLNEMELKLNETINAKYQLNSESLDYINSHSSDMPSLGSVINFIDEKYILDQIVEQLVGAVFGRWGAHSFLPNEIPLTNHFDKLPAFPYAYLQKGESKNEFHFELTKKHNLDVENMIIKLRSILRHFWNSSADQIEEELVHLLNINSLESYFSNPNLYFAKHLNNYSKGSRVAPIYWPLSSKSNSYIIWLYYHELNDQSLYKCVNEYVEPKIKEINKELGTLKIEFTKSGSSSKTTLIEELTDLSIELTDFRNELLRIARLPFNPNLNDGVLINAAPLNKLFMHSKWQKITEECWEKLEDGEYDWSHMAMSIWPVRVKEKCKTDRSIAIAHNLEELYVETKTKKKK